MKSLIISILIIAVFYSTGKAGIIHVPTDTATIQGGIYLAQEGDTVLVAENTYYENINFKGKAITVASQFIMDGDTSHISKTTIDGSKSANPDSGSVVYAVSGEDTTSVICGFTITGGTGTKLRDPNWGDFTMGGGIYIQESGVIVEDNIIKNNRLVNAGDTYGGGISVLKILGGNRFVIIRNNSIAHNFLKGNMTGAGGIYIGWEGEPVMNYIIENNIISNNIVENTDNWKAYGRRDIFRMCFTIYRYKNSKKQYHKR